MNHDDLLTAEISDFTDRIRQIHSDHAKSWTDGEEVMMLARAICESDGGNPDGIVMGMANGQPMYDRKGTLALTRPIAPLWWHYVQEAVTARKFIRQSTPVTLTDTKAVVDFMAEVRKAAGR